MFTQAEVGSDAAWHLSGVALILFWEQARGSGPLFSYYRILLKSVTCNWLILNLLQAARWTCLNFAASQRIRSYKIAYTPVDGKPEITRKLLKGLVGAGRRFENLFEPFWALSGN